MSIRKRISGDVIVRKRRFAKITKLSNRKTKIKTLQEYLERLPDPKSPAARIRFKDLVRDYVLPYQRKFQFSGYPVTLYPVYRNEILKDSPFVQIYSVDVGFCVREKSGEIVCRLGNDKARWTADLNIAVVRIKDYGYTPKN